MNGLFCQQELIDDIKQTITGNDNNKSTNINSAIKLFFGMLLDCLTPELCKAFILSILDKLDVLVKQTDNKVDDFVVNAVTNKIRSLLDDNSQLTNNELNCNQKRELDLEINKLVEECDSNIQTGKFDPFSSTNLFQNISANINSMNCNPFEKENNINPFENK